VKTPLQFGPIILTRLSANPLSFARAGKESTSVADLWSAITFIAAGLNLRRSSPATIIGLPLVVRTKYRILINLRTERDRIGLLSMVESIKASPIAGLAHYV
jgi:hypothetical protein